jgi:hypothetical protein
MLIALDALAMLFPAPPLLRLLRALLIRREIARSFERLDVSRRRTQRTQAILAAATVGAVVLMGRHEARRQLEAG